MGNFISKFINGFRKIQILCKKNNENSTLTQSDRCLSYNLQAVLSVFKVFGIEPFEKCSCFEEENHGKLHNKKHVFYDFYVKMIELFLWFSSFYRFMLTFSERSFCHSSVHVFGKYSKEIGVVIIILNIYIAVQFSVLKRNKISFHFMKSTYKDEKYLLLQMKLPVIRYWSIVFLFVLIVSNSVAMVEFSTIKRYSGSELEATFCCIYFWFLHLQLIVQICSLLLMFSLWGIILVKRLIKLCEELQQINTISLLLKKELQEICEKHTEIWEMFEMINKQWEDLHAFIYAHFAYETCFLLFATMFFDMDVAIRAFYGCLSMMFLTGCFLVSWGLSYLTSLIYDNFVSIERFSSNNLSVEFKFKVRYK
ncbi:uncharacterized protein LOC111614107 [Centruroides sculpturatus]|uniref:uncharacterized protein LOC111614107 n=1 Tax=Centruroides sculpturatus TaxID=218467 RepID=UPI000C6D49A7|nr:uncharacterized protein LOC111614107 [Centruroides sculpturatus]